MKNILKKLIMIQQELKCRKDKQAQNYKYRSAEDILENLKPILSAVDCTLLISDDVEVIGNETYYKSTITLYDFQSEESVSNHSYVKEGEAKFMSVGQYSGATISYCRKYALCGMFMIDDGEDLDSVEDKKTEKKEKKIFDMAKFGEFCKNREKRKDSKSAIEDISKYYEISEDMKKKIEGVYNLTECKGL